MGLFPTDAVNNQEVTNANGTTFRYNDTDDKWVIVPSGDINITLMDATPSSNAEYHGTVLEIDTTSCSNYQVVYCDGANSVLPADADAIATCKVIGMVVGAGKVLTDGIVRNDSWTLTPNAVYFASTTPGAITTIKPAGNTDVVIAIGIAVGVDQMLVRPGYAWVEVVF